MSTERDQWIIDQCGPGLSTNATRIIRRLLDVGYERTIADKNLLQFSRRLASNRRRTVVLWFRQGRGGSRRVGSVIVWDITTTRVAGRTADLDAWLDREAQP